MVTNSTTNQCGADWHANNNIIVASKKHKWPVTMKNSKKIGLELDYIM
jgi:hypothetical protein